MKIVKEFPEDEDIAFVYYTLFKFTGGEKYRKRALKMRQQSMQCLVNLRQ
ncbi:MAG: hypothetical protein AB7T10_02740 [bacterium]